MNVEPYYVGKKEFSVSNQSKGKLGESAFSSALTDFPILCNITYGKRQKDIDHLVFTGHYVVLNECKNTKENFQMYYSWFLSARDLPKESTDSRIGIEEPRFNIQKWDSGGDTELPQSLCKN